MEYILDYFFHIWVYQGFSDMVLDMINAVYHDKPVDFKLDW